MHSLELDFKSINNWSLILKSLYLTFSIFRYSQSLNISFILSVTLILSQLKLDKSNDVNDLQPENIELIFVTLLVLKLDKLIDVNDLQKENISYIFITLLVLKLDKLIDDNDLQ